ncbi:hypothetical protein P7C73_g2948, partial [Tremellales sp. Uapishka_1]
MLSSFALLSILLAPLALAVNTIYWPVSSPSPTYPWVIGSKNLLSWTTGGGSGIESFDVQLHNANRNIMVGFIPIALRVPMQRLTTGSKNYGGEIEVDLNGNMPTGDGFSLIFMNTLHGESQKFSIYSSAPSNYTAVGTSSASPSSLFFPLANPRNAHPCHAPADTSTDLPTATITATLSELPNPTQQWALTLDGVDPDSTATATNIAGDAGSGH